MSENRSELVERINALEEEMDEAQAMINKACSNIKRLPFGVQWLLNIQLKRRQEILDLQRFKLKGARDYLIKNPE